MFCWCWFLLGGHHLSSANNRRRQHCSLFPPLAYLVVLIEDNSCCHLLTGLHHMMCMWRACVDHTMFHPIRTHTILLPGTRTGGQLIWSQTPRSSSSTGPSPLWSTLELPDLSDTHTLTPPSLFEISLMPHVFT